LSEHFQKTLHYEKDRRFQIPCQPSGRPSVHCSIRLDDVFILTGHQTDQHHTSGRRIFPSGPFTVSRSFCSNLHPSGHLSSSSGRPSVIDQLQILSKFRIWEDLHTVWMRSYIRQESQFKYHRPDISQPWSGRACN
jgi:hypothetical protein